MVNPTNKNHITLDVINKLAKAANTPQLKQLRSAQRELVRTIIQDSGRNFSKYEENHKKNLDKILATLDGRVAPRKETWGANFMRWLKNFFGFRISSEKLKNDIMTAKNPLFLLTALPRPLQDDLLSPIQNLPEEAIVAGNLLVQEHLKLLSMRADEHIDLADPIFNPIHDALHKCKNLNNDYLRMIYFYIEQADLGNTQDAFTAFETNAEETQKNRLDNNIQDAIKSTKGPGLEKEHSWAKNGFRRPHLPLNFWLKISLENTSTDDIHHMKFESRINGKEVPNFQENQIVNVRVDLTPFQQEKGTPLTKKQKKLILAFLRRERPYTSVKYIYEARFNNLKFLSEDQKTQLDQLHEQLLVNFAVATREIYRRNLTSS